MAPSPGFVLPIILRVEALCRIPVLRSFMFDFSRKLPNYDLFIIYLPLPAYGGDNYLSKNGISAFKWLYNFGELLSAPNYYESICLLNSVLSRSRMLSWAFSRVFSWLKSSWLGLGKFDKFAAFCNCFF